MKKVRQKHASVVDTQIYTRTIHTPSQLYIRCHDQLPTLTNAPSNLHSKRSRASQMRVPRSPPPAASLLLCLPLPPLPPAFACPSSLPSPSPPRLRPPSLRTPPKNPLHPTLRPSPPTPSSGARMPQPFPPASPQSAPASPTSGGATSPRPTAWTRLVPSRAQATTGGVA